MDTTQGKAQKSRVRHMFRWWRRRWKIPTNVTKTFGEPPSGQISLVQVWLEKKVLEIGEETKWEYLALLDQKGGDHYVETCFSHHGGRHSPMVERFLNDPRRSIVVIHNHPSSKDPNIVALGLSEPTRSRAPPTRRRKTDAENPEKIP